MGKSDPKNLTHKSIIFLDEEKLKKIIVCESKLFYFFYLFPMLTFLAHYTGSKNLNYYFNNSLYCFIWRGRENSFFKQEKNKYFQKINKKNKNKLHYTVIIYYFLR